MHQLLWSIFNLLVVGFALKAVLIFKGELIFNVSDKMNTLGISLGSMVLLVIFTEKNYFAAFHGTNSQIWNKTNPYAAFPKTCFA